MSNLAELYHSSLSYRELKIGMKLKVAGKGITLSSEEEKTCEIGDIATIIDIAPCSTICHDCLCNGKYFVTRLENNEEVPNCCYFKFTDLNGRKITYE
jgi:hypothetical protein